MPTHIYFSSKWALAFDIPFQSQAISRKMIYFDQIALIDAENSAETQLGILEATNTGNKLDMLFWAPITIRGYRVLFEKTPGVWTATSMSDMPMLGIQLRLPSDLWNE